MYRTRNTGGGSHGALSDNRLADDVHAQDIAFWGVSRVTQRISLQTKIWAVFFLKANTDGGSGAPARAASGWAMTDAGEEADQ